MSDNEKKEELSDEELDKIAGGVKLNDKAEASDVYMCNNCGMTFKSKAKLKEHVKQYHS